MQNIIASGRSPAKRVVAPFPGYKARQHQKGARGGNPVHIQQFLHLLTAAKSHLAVQECLRDVSRHYGFDNFYICSFSTVAPARPPTVIGDFPPPFLEHYITKRWWRADPAALMNQRRMTPYSWCEAPADTLATQTFREAVAHFGAANGWVIPWHIPGNWSGFCSFSVSARGTLPDADLPTLQYLVIHAVDILHRVHGRHEHSYPRLTPRQVQCVILAAQGKSDWVSGQLLGLSPATIHKYLEQAKARYGVSSRTELVVRALYDKQISFADLIN